MKIKKLIFPVLFCCLFLVAKTFSYEGEFKVYVHNYNGHGTITLTTQGNAWTWDNVHNHVKMTPGISETHSLSSGLIYDAPKSSENGYAAMPWCLLKIEIVGTQSSSPDGYGGFTYVDRTVFIDFRDEGWSQDANRYAAADIELHIVYGTRYIPIDVYLKVSGVQEIHGFSGTENAWDAYEAGNPDVSNFNNPLYLKNLINSQNAGGTLSVGSLVYNSFDTASVTYGNYSLKTNSERFLNYGGQGNTGPYPNL